MSSFLHDVQKIPAQPYLAKLVSRTVSASIGQSLPERTLKEIFLFLGLPELAPVQQQEYKQLNSSTYSQAKMEPEMRKRLLTYFEPYNERLYTLLGRDFGWDR